MASFPRITLQPGAAPELVQSAARWNQILALLDASRRPLVGTDLAGLETELDAAALLAMGRVGLDVLSDGDVTGKMLMVNLSNELLGIASPNTRPLIAIPVKVEPPSSSTPPPAPPGPLRSGPCEDPTCPQCRAQREGRKPDPETRH